MSGGDDRTLGEVSRALGAAGKGRRVYKVGVPKEYFPAAVRMEVNGNAVTSILGLPLRVRASSRTEAARVAWEEKGGEWLALMARGGATPSRVVSLHVDDPEAPGNGGALGRMPPIRVRG